MNVWRLITHHEDKDAALFWTRQNSRIAIGGERLETFVTGATTRPTILHLRSERRTLIWIIRI